MKTNAPEKLYLSDIQRYFGDKDMTASTIRYADDDIEYIRNDAFIEKVYEWLKNYAFTDDENKVHLPTLLHDFLKDIRNL